MTGNESFSPKHIETGSQGIDTNRMCPSLQPTQTQPDEAGQHQVTNPVSPPRLKPLVTGSKAHLRVQRPWSKVEDKNLLDRPASHDITVRERFMNESAREAPWNGILEVTLADTLASSGASTTAGKEASDEESMVVTVGNSSRPEAQDNTAQE